MSDGDYKKGSSVSAEFQAGLGGDANNAYFLKFLSATTGGSIINYSDRFTLSAMTGVFPAAVEAGLKTVTGTAGPRTENDIQAPENNPGAPQAPAAGGTASFALPYALQTGPIRYAPMAPVGQTKIIAKGQSMQYPTSAYTIARTFLGSADCVSTAFEPQTAVFQTRENNVRHAC